MNRWLTWPLEQRWTWSFVAIIALSVSTSQFSLNSLSGVLSAAGFLAFPALTQMVVITTGRGNIDLSIPSLMTLSAFLSMILIGPSNAALPLGLVVLMAVGAAVGAVNALLVLKVRVPAKIATLATGYMLATLTLLSNRRYTAYGVSPVLKLIASSRFLGVPMIMVCACILAAGLGFVLNRTAYGMSLTAYGQNHRAAALAGVATQCVVLIAFMTSGVIAAIGGCLLTANAGGAFLDMGSPYLLQSVGAVVVGGTLISGGNSTVLGTLFGSVLLIMIVATMQIVGLAPGMEDVMQGCIIIGVLMLTGISQTAFARASLSGAKT